jgi:spermidine/putrescine ABC transporter ATP-binding subunit
MSGLLTIEGVTKRFGSVTAVDDVSLEIEANEFFGLLGPSGCGKTTLLRVLAGFERPDSGRVLLDGQDLTPLKPYRRPLNMMFQSYALFPHMTVEKNVAYGLRMEGVGRRDALRRAHEALELVQLRGEAGRRPDRLSGGQKQRVALARALVKQPRVLLLDEPLSALDRQIRGEMQIELKRLQHQIGITFVVVTHDQEEALTMADRVAVMNAGRIEQLGAPDTLYDTPASTFVARFLGDSNLFPGTIQEREGAPVLRAGRHEWALDPDAVERVGLRSGDDASVLVRPERLLVDSESAPGEASAAPNVLRGSVVETIFLGSSRKVVVDLDEGGSVQARIAARGAGTPPAHGDRVVVAWDPVDGVVVPAGLSGS